MISKTINASTTTYSYDATGQLIQAGGTTYQYDANGNPTGSGQVVGVDNELQSDGTWTYSYDAAGKVGISNGLTWVYGYNNANRLVSAVETETATGAVVETATYVYDVMSNLLSETITTGGVTTVSGYAYTADGTLYADVSGGVIETRYVAGVLGADTWLARVTTAGGAWLLSDYQGSIMLVVGLTGGVQDSIIYDGFGNITSESNASGRGELGFQGGRYDAATGNWVYGVREMNPSTLHWMTQDPQGLGPDSNPVRFAGNSPTNSTDPTGMYETPTASRGAAPGGYRTDPSRYPEYNLTQNKTDKETLLDLCATWDNKSWSYPANLLRHFLTANGAEHIATSLEVKECEPHLEAMVRAVLENEACRSGDWLRGIVDKGCKVIHGTFTGLPQGSGYQHVRWDNWASSQLPVGPGFPRIADDYMFYAYAGADININGELTNFRVKRTKLTFDAELTVVVKDNYTFKPEGPLGFRLLFPAYAAANRLELNGTAKAFRNVLTAHVSYHNMTIWPEQMTPIGGFP